MTLIVDASVIVAALVDSGSDGAWAEGQVSGGDLVAPSLMPFECANVIRRLAAAGTISDDIAHLAHRDLLALPIELANYELVSERAWELRNNATVYDASYVALAELLGAPLATLDRRLAAAPTARCTFRTPNVSS